MLANANPNVLLRFMCQVINHLLRHSVAMGEPSLPAGHELGETNVAAHKPLLAAARKGDAARVAKLMVEHIDEAEQHVLTLQRRRAPALRQRGRSAAAHPACQAGEEAMIAPYRSSPDDDRVWEPPS